MIIIEVEPIHYLVTVFSYNFLIKENIQKMSLNFPFLGGFVLRFRGKNKKEE